MTHNIELLLFSTDPVFSEIADRAGIDGFIIDWENRARFQRLQSAEDMSKPDTAIDIERITSITNQPVWCRINQFGEWSQNEIELAITHGADLILLPMVRTVEEVTKFLSIVKGRTKAGILVETLEACACADKLARLPLDCIYVGLWDLFLSRGGDGDIFTPLTDGTVEKLRNDFHKNHFGVGGLTTTDKGFPVPCMELMANLVSVGCDFTFLRNSFKRDLIGRNMADELNLIRSSWQSLCSNLDK